MGRDGVEALSSALSGFSLIQSVETAELDCVQQGFLSDIALRAGCGALANHRFVTFEGLVGIRTKLAAQIGFE